MINALNSIATVSHSLEIGSQNGGHSAHFAGFNVQRGNGAHGATAKQEDICRLRFRVCHDESSQQMLKQQQRRGAQQIRPGIDENNV